MAIVNLVRYSNQLLNPIYTLGSVAFADITSISPASPTTKTFRMVAITTGWQWVFEAGIPEYQPNTRFTASVFVKQENWKNQINLLVDCFDNLGVRVGYNPTARTISSPISMGWTSITASIVQYPNGWDQIILSGTTSGATSKTLRISLQTETNAASVGDSILLGGFTLYQGSYSAFVPTTTSPRGSNFLPVFPFIKHRVSTRYPMNGTNIQLGAGYVFAARPTSPPQRIFVLSFNALQWFLGNDGYVDIYSRPDINLGALDQFYRDNQTYASFTYNHPIYGALQVKFFKPLEIPIGEPGGTGVVANVSVELIEQV